MQLQSELQNVKWFTRRKHFFEGLGEIRCVVSITKGILSQLTLDTTDGCGSLHSLEMWDIWASHCKKSWMSMFFFLFLPICISLQNPRVCARVSFWTDATTFPDNLIEQISLWGRSLDWKKELRRKIVSERQRKTIRSTSGQGLHLITEYKRLSFSLLILNTN